jgi:hypothetical protein
MSSIKIFFHERFGQVIGDVTENLDGTTIVKNPCSIQQVGGDKIMLYPVLSMVEEQSLTLQSSDITEYFTPVQQIYNNYSAQFGGIELVTQPLIK